MKGQRLKKTHDRKDQSTDAFAQVLALMDRENLIRPLTSKWERKTLMKHKYPRILSSKLTKEEISKRIREINANIEAMIHPSDDSSIAFSPPVSNLPLD